MTRLVATCLQMNTRADGATEDQVQMFEAKQAAERELKIAEAEVARQKAQKRAPNRDALKRLEAAEEALEELMQENLDDFAEE